MFKERVMRVQGLNRRPLATFISGLVGILVFGAFPSGCITLAAAQSEDHGVVFDQYEVVIGSATRQTVLTGFLLGGAFAELAVVNIDGKDDRRLRLDAFGDGTWAPKLDATLRPGVLFVDVANIGGRDRLLTYESGRLNWFDPDSASEEELVEVAVNVIATDAGEIPHVDITHDVNRDGRDDIVMPDVDGFWISTQSSDGSFTDPVKLGPPEPFLDEIAPEDTRTCGEVGITPLTIPWYLSRVHEVDYDRDGRSDLVFWNEDHFDVHHQDASGSFDPVAQSFPAGVPFDADGIYSHVFGCSDVSTFSLAMGFRAKTKRTVLHSLQDMNGDGVADLVTHSIEGRSLLKLRASWDVHFGTPTPGGIEFASQASTAIHPRGYTVLGYQTHVL